MCAAYVFVGQTSCHLYVFYCLPLHAPLFCSFCSRDWSYLLLPAISKIFEKVLFKQLYDFFQYKKLFYNAKYGFRTEHSTEFTALELVDRVIIEMDKSDTPINIFLDLSKASTPFNHKILLENLEYYGIKGVAHELLESYITNRKQFVEINDAKSDTLTVTIGVPQGSILSPLLFFIYINDIALSNK